MRLHITNALRVQANTFAHSSKLIFPHSTVSTWREANVANVFSRRGECIRMRKQMRLHTQANMVARRDMQTQNTRLLYLDLSGTVRDHS